MEFDSVFLGGGGVPVRYFFEGLDFGVIFVSWKEVTEELAGHSLFFVEIVFGCFGLGGLVARFEFGNTPLELVCFYNVFPGWFVFYLGM